jgi:hypothetical protein
VPLPRGQQATRIGLKNSFSCIQKIKLGHDTDYNLNQVEHDLVLAIPISKNNKYPLKIEQKRDFDKIPIKTSKKGLKMCQSVP